MEEQDQENNFSDLFNETPSTKIQDYHLDDSDVNTLKK